MTVTDYVGVSGFMVDIDCYEDLVEALDRMHTQVCDLLEEIERFETNNPGLKGLGCEEEFELMARVLEEAMEKL